MPESAGQRLFGFRAANFQARPELLAGGQTGGRDDRYCPGTRTRRWRRKGACPTGGNRAHEPPKLLLPHIVADGEALQRARDDVVLRSGRDDQLKIERDRGAVVQPRQGFAGEEMQGGRGDADLAATLVREASPATTQSSRRAPEPRGSEASERCCQARCAETVKNSFPRSIPE